MDYDYDAPTNMPPCGYCEGMADCETCGTHCRCEEMNETNDGGFQCVDCYEAAREVADK